MIDDSALQAIARIQLAFSGERGPACYRFDHSGSFYETEGKDIERALLNLDPSDLCEDDLLLHSEFLPRWATDSGFRWLLPGLFRIAFELPDGEWVLDATFSELEQRIERGGIELSGLQRSGILYVQECFYTTEKYNWNARANETRFIAWLRVVSRAGD